MNKREWELEAVVFETLFTQIHIDCSRTMEALHFLFIKKWENKQIIYRHEFINKQFLLFLMAREKGVKFPIME